MKTKADTSKAIIAYQSKIIKEQRWYIEYQDRTIKRLMERIKYMKDHRYSTGIKRNTKKKYVSY